MGIMSKLKRNRDEAAHEPSGTGRNPPLPDQDMEKLDDSPIHIWNFHVISMILVRRCERGYQM